MKAMASGPFPYPFCGSHTHPINHAPQFSARARRFSIWRSVLFQYSVALHSPVSTIILSPSPTRPQPPPVHDGEGEAIGSGRCRHGRRRRAEEPAAAYRGGPGTWSACSLARSCVDRFQPAAEYLPLRASRRWPDGAERCRPRAAMRASDLGEHGFQRVPPASGAMAASPAGCQCGCFLDTLLA